MHIKKSNKELLLVCMMIVLVAAINLFVYRATHLQEPIFLTHEYIVAEEENTTLCFYYIYNTEEKERIVDVIFPQMQGERHSGVFLQHKKVGDYGIYGLYEITIKFPWVDTLQNRETITQMELVWSDQRHTMEEIGHIRFLESDIGIDTYTSYQKIQSTDTSSTLSFVPKEDMTLTGLKIPLEGYEDLWSISNADGEALVFPTHYTAGTEVHLQVKMNMSSRDERKHAVIKMMPYIQIECADGTKVTCTFSDWMRYQPKWTTREIYRILSIKGVS